MSLIVVIRNISELAPVSDYEYTVMVGDGSPKSKIIASGIVVGHIRADGWQKLVAQVVEHAK